jgi:site-specific recombinase XerD
LTLSLYEFIDRGGGMNRRVIGLDGPLTVHECGFRAELERRGYGPDAVRWQIRHLRALNRWLADRRLDVCDVDADCIRDLVSARQRAGRSTLVLAANFSLLLAYLREIGVVPPEVPRTDPAGEILGRYRDFLILERGLAESSIFSYLLVAERFCCDVLNRYADPAQLSAAEVTEYMVAVCGRCSIGWSKKTVTALASLLRFLHVSGTIPTNLAAALPKVAGHRPSLAPAVSEDEFRRMLAACDRSSDVGLRDYAILTALWRLGLRRGEVANLTVDDIDWRRGEITIHGKGNRHELVPLPADVGETIAAYLRDGHRRVPPGCRALFVKVRAAEGALTGIAVGDVTTRVSRRAGLPAISAHRFRRGTATQLVLHGAPWSEIAQLMRHRTLAVTRSYTTIDAVLTGELARPWPGAR